MREYDSEPVRGLPELLPAGEELLWQTSPQWGSLARRALHVRKVAFYFSLLIIWRITLSLQAGHTVETTLIASMWLVFLAIIASGVLMLLAWLYHRTTVYSLTNRRIVIRFGVAVQLAMNIPLSKIEAAAVKTYADGTGDLLLTLNSDYRISYLVMWPHVRPWRIAVAQPMLRSIPDAHLRVAILAKVLEASAATVAPPSQQESVPAVALDAMKAEL